MVLTEFSSGARLGALALRGDLSAAQRWVLSVCVVVLHVMVAALVWYTASAPVQPVEQAPLMVSLITDSVVEPLPAPVPPEPVKTPPVQPQAVQPPTPRRETPMLAAARPAQPTEMQAPVAVPEPVVNTPVAPSAKAAPSNEPVTPPPPSAPKVLPSSSVRFLIKPTATFPPASLELGECGNVDGMLDVDEQGRVSDVKLVKSSGYPRLDRAAMAAERVARLQPSIDNGVPRSVLAPHRMTFDCNHEP
jgi:protein TonB